MPKFEATCAVSIFKQSLKGLLETGIWKISPEGLKYQGYRKFDIEHEFDITLMAELYLSPTEFEKFECKEEFLMGINPKHFRTVLNCADWTDNVVFIIEEDANHLDLIILSERGGCKKSQTFELKFISVEGIKKFSESKYLEYECELEMPSERFVDITNAIRKISANKNDIKICMTRKKVMFESVGDSKCLKSTVTITPRDKDYSYKSSGSVEVFFRNIFLHYPAQNKLLSDKIWLKCSKQKWFVVEYKIQKCGYLKYYMLPLTEKQHSKKKGNSWKQQRFNE